MMPADCLKKLSPETQRDRFARLTQLFSRPAVFAVLAAVVVLFIAQPRLAAEPASAAPAFTTFFPTPTDLYLVNPGIGWQEAEDLENPVLPEAVPFRRPQYNWQSQNPAEGVYDWSEVDADLQGAINSGKQFSFRIYSMRSTSNGGHQVPDWVLTKGAEILSNGEVDYSNCAYQEWWGKFVDALRLKYNGNSNIAFIDISGYGNYNEWSWHDQTDTDEDSLDYQARQRLADAFIGGSGTIECHDADGGIQRVSYSYTGFQATQLVMPFAGIQQSSRYVAAERPDVGIRHDCLGDAAHTDTLLEKIGDLIEDTWRNAPIVYEFCSNGGTNNPDFMAEADAVLQQTHGSLVHDNTMDGRDPAMLEDLLRYAGYRYVLTETAFATGAAAGGPWEISMTWENAGYAPSYPRMGQTFELHLYLTRPDGTVAQDWTVEADISGWMPADTIPGAPPQQPVDSTLVVAPTVAAGNYTLEVAIVDTRTGDPISLAIEGPNADGRYEMGTLAIGPSHLPYSNFVPMALQ